MLRKETATDHVDFLVHTLNDLGWKINSGKSQLVPDVSCSFIGFDICSQGVNGPWIKVMQSKVRKLKSAIRRALSLNLLSARQLARIAGQCIAMTKAVLPARLLLRNIYRTIASKRDWQSMLFLDKHCREDLHWWLCALDQWNGAPLNLKSPDLQITVDASSYGWGAAITGTEFEASGTWSKDISFRHSNYRELLAVLLALKSFQCQTRGKAVQILSDNITTVAYVNHLGGKDREFTDLTKTIFMQCQDNQVQLQIKHLAGVLNERADRLSRQVSPYEWMLHPQIFKMIDSMWGRHTIDRFASWRTAQIAKYNSYFSDPGTAAVDALAQPWRGENNFINPPFHLLSRVLQKLIAEEATATIIAPWWPNQPWFRSILRHSIRPPFQIKNSPNIMLKCTSKPEPWKNWSWRIFAWRVSGKGNSEKSCGVKKP